MTAFIHDQEGQSNAFKASSKFVLDFRWNRRAAPRQLSNIRIRNLFFFHSVRIEMTEKREHSQDYV